MAPEHRLLLAHHVFYPVVPPASSKIPLPLAAFFLLSRGVVDPCREINLVFLDLS